MRGADVVLTLTALGAALTLTGLAEWTRPPHVSLLEASSQEGARVEVDARVLALGDGPRARYLELSDGARRMPAFAPREPALERGDIVRAVGVVSRTDTGLALSLERVTVLVPTARVERQPAELAHAPAEYDGARVVVRGEARAGMLAGGGARIAMRGDDAPREGQTIVTGLFRYHEPDASYVLWVESWTRP